MFQNPILSGPGKPAGGVRTAQDRRMEQLAGSDFTEILPDVTYRSEA